MITWPGRSIIKAGFSGKRLLESLILWPLTTVYLTGVVTIILVAQHALGVVVGILAFGFVAVLVLLGSMLREMRMIHTLVNSQHDALVARIDQLVDALIAGGVHVPEDPNPRSRRATS